MQPSKKSKEGSVALLKESIQLVCVSRFSSGKIHSTGRRKLGIKSHRRQILQGHVAPHQNSGKKGSVARRHSEVRASLSAVLALPSLRRGHKTKPRTKKDEPAE